jgi:rubrerythrin
MKEGFSSMFKNIEEREKKQVKSYSSTMNRLSERRNTELNRIKQLESNRENLIKKSGGVYDKESFIKIKEYEPQLEKADIAQRSVQKAQTEQRLKRMGQAALNKIEKGAVQVQKTGAKIEKGVERALSQKILRKPEVSVQRYNAERLVSQMGRNQGALVQRRLEVPNRLPVTSRSSMFDNEANQEVKSTMKWFMED